MAWESKNEMMNAISGKNNATQTVWVADMFTTL